MNNGFGSIDTDTIMNNIRNEVLQEKNTVETVSIQSSRIREIKYAIETASSHSAVGLALPPMHKLKGFKRFIGQNLGRIFLRIAQIFTRDQRIVNQQLVTAVKYLTEELDASCAYIKQKETELNRWETDARKYEKQLDDIKNKITSMEKAISHLVSENLRQDNAINEFEIYKKECELSIANLTAKLENSNDQMSTDDAKSYCEFQEKFRGTIADIKERLLFYFNILEERAINLKEQGLFLDLGSGRGEWLELLAERGLEGKGVDINLNMAESCRQRGLIVEHDNCLELLTMLPDSSIGVLTGFHLVEHMGKGELNQLLREGFRVLKPGGILILETPNPQNIIVGSCNFYTDPTHNKPIPPEVLKFTVETFGFKEVEIQYWQEKISYMSYLDEVDDQTAIAKQVRRITELVDPWFNSPPDYAIIARRP